MQRQRVASDRILRPTTSTQAIPPGRRWSVSPASSLPIHPVDQCLDAVEVQHLAGSIADYPTIVLGRNMEKVTGSDVDLLLLIDLDLGSARQDHTHMFRWAVPWTGGCRGGVRPSPPWRVAPLANDHAAHRDQLESALVQHQHFLGCIEAFDDQLDG